VIDASDGRYRLDEKAGYEPVASGFETRGVAELLAMRVQHLAGRPNPYP